MVVDEDVNGGGPVLVGRALDVGHEADGDVVGAEALEVGFVDVEGEKAPGGGDTICLIEFDYVAFVRVFLGAVEVVEAEGDFDSGVGGDVGVGLVVVFGIPGY